MQQIEIMKRLTWWRADLIVATLVQNFLLVAGMVITLHMASNFSGSSWGETLLSAGILIPVILFYTFVTHARQNLMLWIERQNFYHKSYHQFQSLTSQTTTILGSSENLCDSKSILLNSLFIDLIRVPVIIGLLATLSTNLAAVLSVLLLISLLVALYQGNKITKTLLNRTTQNNQMDQIQQESLKNYQTLKLLGMESLILRRYEKYCYDKGYNINVSTLLGLATRDTFFIVQIIAYIVIFLVLGFEYSHTALSLDQLIICLFLSTIIFTPIQALLFHWDDIKHYRLSKKNQQEQTEKCTESSPRIDLDGSITLENVDFQYSNSDTAVLLSTNLTIQPNTIVTIYGQSGSGKTTLTKLLMKHISPDQGKIWFGETEIRDISAESLRQQVMYLSSESQLYAGTILENLTFFKIGPLVDEAIKLSQRLGLDTWVQNQPLAYQTPIFDSLDSSLPSGIKQRIGLIRALLQEPRILILDEANSYLDEPGDQALKAVLQEMKEAMTIIFITHRPSLKKIATESYDLTNGQLLPSLNIDGPELKSYRSSVREKKAGGA